MKNRDNITTINEVPDTVRRKAEVLFSAVIIARSSSFLLAKIGLNTFGVFSLLAIRFLIAFLLLAIVFHKKLKYLRLKTVFYGFLMGALLFLVMSTEFAALKTVTASETSLIENMAIVFVPLFECILLRRRPKQMTIVCALTAFAGVAFLTMKNGFSFAFTTGELFCFAAAISYSAMLILTDRLTGKDDPLLLGILQVGFLGILAAIAAFLFETPQLPSTGMDWFIVLYLAIVCTCFGFTFQPVAQSKMTAERAGLLSSLNPAFAAILSMIFLGERLGVMGICGAVLILAAILLPSIVKQKA